MKVDVYVMFKIKYGVNIMHPIIFSHKEGGLMAKDLISMHMV